MRKDFIYLASASPRRRALLAQIGVPFQARPVRVCEQRRAEESPEAYVLRLAEAKASALWETLGPEEARPVLGADTVVVLGDTLFGKPSGEDAAMRMLAALSERSHRVLTGVAVRFRDQVTTRLNCSEVRFRATTERERRAYCNTGEPLDKAGAYGVQGLGAVFVEHIAGSYSSVMGLPLAETAALLSRFGFPAWLAGDESTA